MRAFWYIYLAKRVELFIWVTGRMVFHFMFPYSLFWMLFLPQLPHFCTNLLLANSPFINLKSFHDYKSENCSMISSSFCSSIDIQTDFFLIQLPFVRYSYSLTLYFSSAYSTFLLRVITVHLFLWKKSEPILNLIISSKKAEHIYFLNKCCISFLKLEKKKNKE